MFEGWNGSRVGSLVDEIDNVVADPELCGEAESAVQGRALRR